MQGGTASTGPLPLPRAALPPQPGMSPALSYLGIHASRPPAPPCAFLCGLSCWPQLHRPSCTFLDVPAKAEAGHLSFFWKTSQLQVEGMKGSSEGLVTEVLET